MNDAPYNDRTRVLLVEDETACRKMLVSLLTVENFEVAACSCAEDAIDLLSRKTFDAVVSDIMLSGMDGIGLLKHVRKHYGELPVILITGFSTIDSAIKAVQLGAHDYLTKPLGDCKSLVSAINNAVSHYRLELQNTEFLANIKKSEEMFRKLFYDANDAIFLFTASPSGAVQQFMDVNNTACTRLGYEREELLRKTILDITDKEHRPALVNNIQQKPADERNTLIQTVLATKQGARIPVELKSDPITLEGRSFVIARARDISLQLKTETMIASAVEKERQKLGNELHDLLCQNLASIAMLTSVLDNNPDARMINDLAHESVSFVRGLCSGLFPVELEAEGLGPALAQLVQNQRNISDIPCTIQATGDINVPDKNTALHIYRIAQEALSNALKHSQASRVTVSLAQDNGSCTLNIEDDGNGITGEQSSNGGLGLHIMKYRANMIGAALRVAPGNEKGTKVTCSWQRHQ